MISIWKEKVYIEVAMLMRYTTYLNLPEGDEHVVDDIPTKNVWIIEAPLHLPQLILQLLA